MNDRIRRRMLEEQDRAATLLEAQQKEEEQHNIEDQLERARYEAAMRQSTARNQSSAKAVFTEKVTKYVLEEVLSSIFNDCFKDADDKTLAFNDHILSDFIGEETDPAILSRMEESSAFMSQIALDCRRAIKSIVEKAEAADSELIEDDDIRDITDKIDADSEVEDITDEIRMRVSRATEEFVEKNIMDKEGIKDIMLTTKEKIEGIKTGDDTTDNAIKTETTIEGKRKIAQIHKRPHSVYEQLMINLTEASVSNEALREAYTKDGKPNMSALNSLATSIYTFLEFVGSTNLKELTPEYIEETITIK